MYKKICRAELKWPSWFSSDIRKFLQRLLHPNPSARISIAKIMDHPWFRTGLEERLFDYAMNSTENIMPVDMNLALDYLNANTVEGNQAVEKLINLNAFDIISLANGFDLSGIFEETSNKTETKFTSTNTVSTIITKLEEIATSLQLKVTKKGGGLLNMESSKPGRKGVMSIDAEVFHVTSNFHLVEIKKTNGDTLEYQKVMKQGMRPALKDIVWAWQGEQPEKEKQQS
jgi:5'-AMP-activated protein kinase catalytic alpha subunit